MSKTNELRKLIQSKLLTVCSNCFYETAPNDKMYPHIVWNLNHAVISDPYRDDYYLDVDIWDRSTDAKQADQIADDIDKLFRRENLPQTAILPTFYSESRKNITDEDKKIKHRLITIIIQNYEV